MINIVPEQYQKLQPTQSDNTRRKLVHWGDINKNFFATIGCSMTYGVGVEYKNTWSNLLAEQFNMEHINLSFNGSSIEYQSRVVKLLWELLPQTKFCIWMHTFPTRSQNLDESLSDQERRIYDHTAWKDTATWQKILDHFDKFSKANILCTNSWFYPEPYLKMLNGWFKGENKFFVNNDDVTDFANDNKHPGKESHKKLSLDLGNHIKKFFPEWIEKS